MKPLNTWHNVHSSQNLHLMYYTHLLDYCGDWSFVTFAACKEELRIGDGGGCVGAPERPLSLPLFGACTEHAFRVPF